jgi:murein tripeptide amidase MpaA
MFNRGRFWHAGRIYSDEGFFVITGGRDAIIYHEGNRKMTITVNEGNGVYEETIGRWDDNPNQRLGEEERKRIADNIQRAFESQGRRVYFLERQQ